MNKKYLLFAVLALALLMNVSIFSAGEHESENYSNSSVVPGVPYVEIIYLNHGPVRKVITDIDAFLEEYGDRISVSHYTFDSSEGESFAESKKLKGHIPLAIFVDGSMEFTVDNHSVEFFSFPKGQGTGFVEDGAWSVDDLKKVIDGILEQS